MYVWRVPTGTEVSRDKKLKTGGYGTTYLNQKNFS